MAANKKDQIYILSALRRVFGWSDQYKECQKRSRIKAIEAGHEALGFHMCEGCGEVYNKDEVKFAVDHIEPVIPLWGWYPENVLGGRFDDCIVYRMFPGVEELQYLCIYCHQIKSSYEAGERAAYKRSNKSNE